MGRVLAILFTGVLCVMMIVFAQQAASLGMVAAQEEAVPIETNVEGVTLPPVTADTQAELALMSNELRLLREDLRLVHEDLGAQTTRIETLLTENAMLNERVDQTQAENALLRERVVTLESRQTATERATNWAIVGAIVFLGLMILVLFTVTFYWQRQYQ